GAGPHDNPARRLCTTHGAMGRCRVGATNEREGARMQYRNHMRARRLSVAACSLGALIAPQTLLAQNAVPDAPGVSQVSDAATPDNTIVVTGSRIARSEGVAPASPVEVLGSERLEATSTNTM